MKIDSSAKTIAPVPKPVAGRGQGVRPAAPAVTAESTPARQSSTVVSAEMNTVSGTDPAFNSQKVAEIRQAISEGRFQISTERIAEGLITSVREMLERNRRPV